MRELREHQQQGIAALRRSLGLGHRRPMLQAPESEVWLPVVGYEGLYEVSDLGRIRGVARTVAVRTNRWGSSGVRRLPGKVLSLAIDRSSQGYGRLSVKLYREDEGRTWLVHRLVAEAFIGPVPMGMEVAHNDGDASNNHRPNLRYATSIENAGDKRQHGTVLRGEQVGNAKLTEATVREIRAMKGVVTGIELSRRHGISVAQISRIQSRTRWGHVA